MMEKPRASIYLDKLSSFIKDREGQKCYDWSMQWLIKQYALEVCWVPLYNLLDCVTAYRTHPNGPFNHLRVKIANDNNDPMHAPEAWDIAVWSNGDAGIVVHATPWDTYVEVLAQPLGSTEIYQRSYESILWRLRTVSRHSEIAENQRIK